VKDEKWEETKSGRSYFACQLLNSKTAELAGLYQDKGIISCYDTCRNCQI